MIFCEAEAQTVLEEMSHGRNKPLLCTCSASRLSIASKQKTIVESELTDDFVIKLTGCGEMTSRGRLCEFAVALLAQCLGVSAVEPAVVAIPGDLVPVLPSKQKAAVAADNSRHFGSRYLGAGWEIYSPGKQLEASLIDSALSIYVFDMLTQNPDRRPSRPNVLTDGEVLKAYDHELAFPFLLPMLGEKREPWQIRHLKCATEHVFFPLLRGRKLDIGLPIERIRNMDNGIMDDVSAAIPAAWRSDDIGVMFSHLFAVRQSVDKFADEIVRVLT